MPIGCNKQIVNHRFAVQATKHTIQVDESRNKKHKSCLFTKVTCAKVTKNEKVYRRWKKSKKKNSAWFI